MICQCVSVPLLRAVLLESVLAMTLFAYAYLLVAVSEAAVFSVWFLVGATLFSAACGLCRLYVVEEQAAAEALAEG